MLWASLLLTLAAATTVCPTAGGIISLYRGGESNLVYRLLSEHAFLVRRNRYVPPMLVQFSSAQHRGAADAATLRAGAAASRAVLLPADDEPLMARFAEAAGTGDAAARRRLFIGVVVNHSSKRFTGKRLLRILELLRTQYLDLLIVSGRPCRHSAGDRFACAGNRIGPGFLRNWRNLALLARKRRVLHLGLSHYPLSAVRAVHRISTPECLDFPDRSQCKLRGQPESKSKGRAKKKRKQRTKKTGNPKQQKNSDSSATAAEDAHTAYSPKRAAGKSNYLSIVQTAFNPHHRRRGYRRWCLRNSVVLLTDEVLGGPHSEGMLADNRLTSAAAVDQLPIRTAVLHWALKKRAAVAVSPEEAAEFSAAVGDGGLVGKWQHLGMIDSTDSRDLEAQFFMMPPHPHRLPAHMLRNEL